MGNIDTGSTGNYITPEAAKCLKNRIRPVGTGRTGGYGRRMFGKKELVVELSFDFNDEQLCLEFHVMNSSNQFMSFNNAGFQLDGILGSPFLYASKATIDYANLVIRFDKGREQQELEEVD